MLPFLSLLTTGICVLVPIILILFFLFSYGLAIGNLNIVGIARRAKDKKKHWTSVAELTKKTGEFLALTITTMGSILAFLGLLSSWVTVNISNAYDLRLSGLNGTLTGFGLILRSVLGAYQVFQVERGGTINVGAFLLVFALLVFLIFVSLLLSALSAPGIQPQH